MKTIIMLDDKKFGDQFYHSAHVEVIDDNQVRISKYIDIDKLIAAFDKGIVKEDQHYYIGKLPQNYYDGSIRRNGEYLDADIVLTVPRIKMRTLYEETEYMIPYPALLFRFKIRKNKIIETQTYALKGNRWDDKTILYNYPFGNVNTSSHVVCWGRNALPEIVELRQLDAVCSLFYKHLLQMGYRSMYPLAEWPRTIHQIEDIGISRPSVYCDSKHANCIGCLKAGKQHWYKVYCCHRHIFEEAKMVEQEIGYSIIKGVNMSQLELEFERMKAEGVPATENMETYWFWKYARQ